MCILKLRNADGAVLIPRCGNTFLNSTGGAAEHRCNVTASKHLRYKLPAVIHTSYQDTVSSCIIKMSSSGRIIQTSLKLTERLILQQTYFCCCHNVHFRYSFHLPTPTFPFLNGSFEFCFCNFPPYIYTIYISIFISEVVVFNTN